MLIASSGVWCWMGMMAVHELGHVLGAWVTGGEIVKVVVPPLAFSRTDVDPNPVPLVMVWAGAVVGVALPVLLWVALAAGRVRLAYLARLFAGFCLVANGAYIGAGSLRGIGDAGEMIWYGTPRWVMWVFGLVAVVAGLALWHRLGPRFGLGEARGRVDPVGVWVSAGLAVSAVVLGGALSEWM